MCKTTPLCFALGLSHASRGFSGIVTLEGFTLAADAITALKSSGIASSSQSTGAKPCVLGLVAGSSICSHLPSGAPFACASR
eukprot:CAMPEP_0198505160 /NCGR_PEP_ID=MMETSP1462-20131121/10862_1 /TAXON_ID=1333877 /ORGANISM="Brandtodinium nutriculum, Strain RCC3387" /LENGTH=81 /DNA_ID=CAMNT_0044234333 /DNA_START=36 /DNA_END=277 /DNA_ORIENTATION=+